MPLQNRPLLNANLRWFLAGMILANIGGQMLYSMLSLYMIDLGAQVADVGLVFTLASLVPMALQIFGGTAVGFLIPGYDSLISKLPGRSFICSKMIWSSRWEMDE